MDNQSLPARFGPTLARYWPRFWVIFGVLIPPAIMFAISIPYKCHLTILAVVVAPLLILVVAVPVAILSALPATMIPANRYSAIAALAISLALAFAASHSGIPITSNDPCDL